MSRFLTSLSALVSLRLTRGQTWGTPARLGVYSRAFRHPKGSKAGPPPLIRAGLPRSKLQLHTSASRQPVSLYLNGKNGEGDAQGGGGQKTAARRLAVRKSWNRVRAAVTRASAQKSDSRSAAEWRAWREAAGKTSASWRDMTAQLPARDMEAAGGVRSSVRITDVAVIAAGRAEKKARLKGEVAARAAARTGALLVEDASLRPSLRAIVAHCTASSFQGFHLVQVFAAMPGLHIRCVAVVSVQSMPVCLLCRPAKMKGWESVSNARGECECCVE